MRIIFAGTPEFAAQSLKALLTTDHEICAVYTQPDRPSGRGRKLTASAVKQVALENNLPVEQPINFKNQSERDILAAYKADVMIVVAYGILLPQAILDMPKMGCINIHASLLPRWRGAAPIQRAILAGDTETGICIMQMEAGLDTGPVLTRATCPISEQDTSQSLHDTLAQLGAKTLLSTLTNLADLQVKAVPQNDDKTCYADKIVKSEAVINWHHPAKAISQQIRAFNPWPIAQTSWKGTALRIWFAEAINRHNKVSPGEIIATDSDRILVATGDGVIAITHIQTPGKKAMSVKDFLNANKLAVGDHLG
jgi:methionyl-tRNA formyltransferase